MGVYKREQRMPTGARGFLHVSPWVRGQLRTRQYPHPAVHSPQGLRVQLAESRWVAWRGVGRGCRVQAVTWMLLQGAWKKVKCVSTATLESSEGIVSTTRCVSVTGVR
jgi:hypothetical protein